MEQETGQRIWVPTFPSLQGPDDRFGCPSRPMKCVNRFTQVISDREHTLEPRADKFAPPDASSVAISQTSTPGTNTATVREHCGPSFDVPGRSTQQSEGKAIFPSAYRSLRRIGADRLGRVSLLANHSHSRIRQSTEFRRLCGRTTGSSESYHVFPRPLQLISLKAGYLVISRSVLQAI
jgi:hypothetical protein